MIKRYELRPGLVSDDAFIIYSNSDFTLGVDAEGIFYLKGNGWEKLGTIADVEDYLTSWMEGGEEID